MTSNKQKRLSLQQRRAQKREAEIAERARAARQARVAELKAAFARGELLVDQDRLMRGYFDTTEFMRRGTYVPLEFTCGVRDVWTPRQQKWWYETAKGNVYSTAIMCRPCRRRERERRAEARRIHFEGLARKGAREP